MINSTSAVEYIYQVGGKINAGFDTTKTKSLAASCSAAEQ